MDKTLIKWHDLAHDRTTEGLEGWTDPIDYDPNNQCYIHTTCCSQSGMIISLHIQKGTSSVDNRGLTGKEYDLDNGSKIIVHLLKPWMTQNTRCVCVGSYYASVCCAKQLLEMGFRFIGRIHGKCRSFPSNILTQIELDKVGQIQGLVNHLDQQYCQVAFVFRAQNSYQYFVTTCSTLNNNVGQYDPESSPLRMSQTILPSPKTIKEIIPLVVEEYNTGSEVVFHHKACRRECLKLEQKIISKTWHQRVNLAILAIIIVDSYMLYRGSTNRKWDDNVQASIQRDFYQELACELLTNNIMNNKTGKNDGKPGCHVITAAHPEPASNKSKRSMSPIFTPKKRKTDTLI